MSEGGNDRTWMWVGRIADASSLITPIGWVAVTSLLEWLGMPLWQAAIVGLCAAIAFILPVLLRRRAERGTRISFQDTENQGKTHVYPWIFSIVGLLAMLVWIVFLDRSIRRFRPPNAPEGLTATINPPLQKQSQANDAIRWAFLRVPRPCKVRITAATENLQYREEFIREIDKSSVSSVGRMLGDWTIAPCRLVEDPTDQHPNRNVKKAGASSSGTITVNVTSPSSEIVRSETASLLVEQLKQAGFRDVRVGKVLQADNTSDPFYIYLEISSGPIR